MNTTARWFALAAFLVALVACRQDDSTDVGSGSAPIVSAPAPPPPADLVATLVLPRPDETWRALRRAVGASPSPRVPRAAGVLVAHSVGFPLMAAEVVDDRVPWVGAVSGAGDTWRWALAIHARDAEHLIAIVSGGAKPTVTAERDGAITWLERARGAAATSTPAVTAAVVGHYLLLGSGRPAVRHLGPWLSRATGPAAKRDGEDVQIDVHAAVKPPGFWPRSRALWSLVAGDRVRAKMMDMLAAIETGRVALSWSEDHVTARARFEMRMPSAAPAATWPRERLLDWPDDVVAAAAWTDVRAEREASARERAEVIGARFGAPVEEVATPMVAVASAMGDRHRLALRCNGVGMTGVATGEASDQAALQAGLADLVALREMAAVEATLARESLSLEVRPRRLERVPYDLTRLRLSRSDAPEGDVDFLFGVGADRYVAATGSQTVESLQRLAGPDPSRSLARLPGWAEAVEMLPQALGMGAVADVRNLLGCLSGRPGGRPALLAMGTAREGRAWRLALSATPTAVALLLNAVDGR
ncbi:MAG: hypothetical protein AAGN82_05825 [Myxococcota bacterium]